MSETHYRKAFDSPYLSAADIVEPTPLTIREVRLEKDQTKKTKENFNTAYFVESELRPGEKLKPMILNATNSKMVKNITGESFIERWANISVMVYVEPNIKFGRDLVDGLRIAPHKAEKKQLTKANAQAWENAKNAYKRDGNLDAVLSRVSMSDEDQAALIAECQEQAA